MKNLATSIVVIVMVLFSIESQGQSNWTAPTSANKIINPLNKSGKAIKNGKKLYKQLCSICHGNKGKGDGLASAGLNPKPANLVSKKFFSQSEGAIYWKITEGKAPMASYKESLTEIQRWEVINYIKSLKK